MMRYARALGWAALAAGPILLAALAVLSCKPYAPAALAQASAWAAWIAGSFAFGASLLWARGQRRAAKILGGLSVLTVLGFLGLAVSQSSYRGLPLLALDPTDRASLVEVDGILSHPTLGFSFPDPSAHDVTRNSSIAARANREGGAGWTNAHQLYTWEGDDTQLIVDLSHVGHANEATLDEAIRELSPGGPDVSVRRDVPTLRAIVDAPIEGDHVSGHILIHVFLMSRDRDAFRVVFTIVTRAERVDDWRAWLDRAVCPSRAREG